MPVVVIDSDSGDITVVDARLRGLPGADGTDGTDGADGAPGSAGTAITSATGAPSTPGVTAGDLYVDATTGNLYRWS